jgi:L-glutamine-phosphate cytidylyltransferase
MGELTERFPKSFLPIADKRLIDYALDALSDRGFSTVTLVTGYLAEHVRSELGERYRSLHLDYVVSRAYADSGSGWSLLLSKPAWQSKPRPVLLLHADVFFHPGILDRVLASQRDNVLAVDETYQVVTGDEVVVLGDAGRALGLAKGLPKGDPRIVGELIGINRFSTEFAHEFFAALERHFGDRPGEANYEPVLDAFLRSGQRPLHYEPAVGLPWVNLNYPADHENAKRLHSRIYGGTPVRSGV